MNIDFHELCYIPLEKLYKGHSLKGKGYCQGEGLCVRLHRLCTTQFHGRAICINYNKNNTAWSFTPLVRTVTQMENNEELN